MNKNLLIKRIRENIFKVTRYSSVLENRKSLFINEASNGEISDDFKAVENNSIVEFYLNAELVLAEDDTNHTLAFKIGENEGIYGLGLHQHKSFNRRDSNIQMLQINGESTAVPFLTSTGGYAILIDSCSYMSIGIDRECIDSFAEVVDETESKPNTINIYVEDSSEISYYVILGSINDQIRGYRELTGKAVMLPKWAYGYFQSKEHYHTQDEILEVAHKFRDKHIPIDCIVQDWNYWGDYGWNALKWDSKQYPDPKAMVDEIHSLDMKLMVSVWPSFEEGTEVANELLESNASISPTNGKIQKWGVIHDPYNPKGKEIIWSNMKKCHFDLGIDAWWLDSTEPGGDKDKCTILRGFNDTYIGSTKRYLNTFALESGKNTYLSQRECEKNKRVYILTRSGYASQQKYAISTWTGDITASWDCLHRQINSLLSYSMSGIPYHCTDIGGFFVNYEGYHNNPEYRELYTRWYWFGLFSPIFRSHGTNALREIWNYGKPGEAYYDSILRASKIRYALMPYFYSLAYDIYKNDKLFIRPLIMDYPKDEKLLNEADSYLVGDSLLVYNICKYKQYEKEIYLPKGLWYSLFTGKKYEGGKEYIIPTPIDNIPIFVKAGGIILTTSPAECTLYQDNSEIDIRIYSGKDGSSFYYDDNGNNYEYENNDSLIININYNDNARMLTIGEALGNRSYRMPKLFNIYLDNKYIRKIEYKEEKIEISLK